MSAPSASRADAVDRQALAGRFLRSLPLLRRRVEHGFPADLRDELSTVTVHQLEALQCVAGEGGCAMNDLARAQGVGVSSATALADRLIRQGLAERVSDPADRRVVRLVPTDRAVELLERFRTAKLRSTLSLLDPLDDAEAEAFVALVEKITAPGDTEETPRD